MVSSRLIGWILPKRTYSQTIILISGRVCRSSINGQKGLPAWWPPRWSTEDSKCFSQKPVHLFVKQLHALRRCFSKPRPYLTANVPVGLAHGNSAPPPLLLKDASRHTVSRTSPCNLSKIKCIASMCCCQHMNEVSSYLSKARKNPSNMRVKALNADGVFKLFYKRLKLWNCLPPNLISKRGKLANHLMPSSSQDLFL